MKNMYVMGSTFCAVVGFFVMITGIETLGVTVAILGISTIAIGFVLADKADTLIALQTEK